MPKLCSVQGNSDADDDYTNAAGTTDEINPYMSPFQATQKIRIHLKHYCKLLYIRVIFIFHRNPLHDMFHLRGIFVYVCMLQMKPFADL